VADFVIAPLHRVDVLVVDAGAGPELRDQLEDAGLEVVVGAAMAEAVGRG
jgi:hypothetical protein